MNRTYTANIGGQVFHIEEDAYNLLQNYIEQLRQTFSCEEEIEIINDIEGRIRELFSEKISDGRQVILISDVNEIIERMGRPQDLSDSSNSSNQASNSENAPQPAAIPEPANAPIRKKLFRNMQDKCFGGVLSGLARFLGWNTSVMRILFVILLIAINKIFLPVFIAYLIAWMVIPPAVTPRQRLMASGMPINIDTIGQEVIAGTPATPATESPLSAFFRCIGYIAIAFCGLIAAAVVITFLIVSIGVIIAMVVGSSAMADWTILRSCEMESISFSSSAIWMAIVWAIAGIILLIGIIWATCSALFNTRSIPNNTLIGAAILEVILVVIGFILYFNIF